MISILVAFLVILIFISFWNKFQYMLVDCETYIASAWLCGVKWYNLIWLIPATLIIWLLHITRIYRV
jgi:hypothetical protein